MSQIPQYSGSPVPQTPLAADQVDLGALLQKAGVPVGPLLPPSEGKSGTGVGSNTELPNLPTPKLAAGSSLPLDILLDALGEEVRRTEVKAGVNTIKANADQRAAENEKKIQKIDEQIEKLEKASIWDKIGNVFKYIGMAIAAVACVAMIATGVGSAVGVAGLVLIGVSLADNVLDAVGESVSGRGWGLTSLIGWGIEAATGSKEAGMWTKMGLDLAISIAAIVCTCGGSAGSSAGALKDAATLVSKVATVAQTATTVAGAGANIASAVYTKDAETARADQKRLEAILENLRVLNEVTTNHMKHVIEDSQKTTETVNDIVKENAAMQTAILTQNGGAPA